ncbi:hypothetical protein OG413_17390 [Streptomyces sp. NBC_01433]|uniref:hypothetical protein n=1 Tax=Streptomyces sp. NBC_01433 TaxID=2903864 RepID=UPI0022570B61|nr:hypothetical protein [Streptomyces sp. NBC_01433]MCX4677055.1 hypothetical protein [Streptomyces sp. NBC_01433]
MANIERSESLIELERATWAEQQEGRLTVAIAARVQQAITDHATATGQDRYQVETALEKPVRHFEPPADV